MYTKLLAALAVILALLSLSIVSAQEEARLNTTQYRLDNGLEVILVEDHSAPTVAVNVWYRVGGANDPDGRSGFAHLFEHIMFEGSAHVPAGEFDVLNTEAGGENNAYTDKDVTGYYQVVPSHQLPLALWLDADRMASLAVNQTNLDNQRAVVIEEYQYRVGNAPYGEAYEDLFTLPFDYAPYRKRVIGSVEDLNQATIEDVRAFHDTYYAPNNATLVVAGDINVEQTRAFIDQFFGSIPAKAAPPELPVYDPQPQTEAVIIHIVDGQIDVPALFIAYNIPTKSHPDYPALQLFDSIMSFADSSRIAQALIDTGLAQSAYTYIVDYRAASLYIVEIYPNEGVDLEQVEQVFYDELDKIIEQGVTRTEMDKAYNLLRSTQIAGLESVENLAESVQTANYFYGDPQMVFGEYDRLFDVTSADIQRVIADYLAPEQRHVFYVEPGDVEPVEYPSPVVGGTGSPEDDAVSYAFTIDQTTPPDPLPLKDFTLPDINEAVLDNGVQVVVVSRHDLPLLSIDLVLPGGASAVPAGQAGLADLTASLLTRGTESRSAQDIANTIEQVGGILSASADVDNLSISVSALSDDTDLAFEMIADAVLHSTFPEDELEVQRDILLSNLEYALSDPATLASRTFSATLYGAHPYGNTPTAETIGALTRDDVVGYYQTQLSSDRALLIVAGDIDFEDALSKAETAFGSWQAASDTASASFPAPPERTGMQIYLVDRPGSTQASFVIGNLTTRGDTPERFAMQVMNRILGGGFKSRLNDDLREDKGYTYGIYSSVSFDVDLNTFSISTDVRNEIAANALKTILGHLETISAEPVPPDELDFYKSAMIGSYARSLESTESFVSRIASLKLRGLPLSSMGEYVQNIEQVDQAAVSAAARTTIDLDGLAIVVVGDASALQSGLETIAPVTVVKAET